MGAACPVVKGLSDDAGLHPAIPGLLLGSPDKLERLTIVLAIVDGQSKLCSPARAFSGQM